MTRAQAQAIALTAMELSGKTVGQMWADLRAAEGHRPNKVRPTWSDVHDWVTALVLDAAAEDLRRKPLWVLVFLQRGAVHA